MRRAKLIIAYAEAPSSEQMNVHSRFSWRAVVSRVGGFLREATKKMADLMVDHGRFERPPYLKPNPAILKLNGMGFAWEFVRRNKRYCNVWEDQQPTFEEMQAVRGMRVIALREQTNQLFPCLWSSAPNLGATEADVAWHPLASPKILRAVALSPKIAQGGVIFDPSEYDLEKTLVVSRDGSQELLLRDGPRILQLHIIGGTLKEGDALFVDTAGIDDSFAQSQALACFRELRKTGILLNKYFSPHISAVRLSQYLLAFDCFAAGASHREIAVIIYGEGIVDRDWNNPRELLMDRTRRTIARSQVMVERGFLGLLRGHV